MLVKMSDAEYFSKPAVNQSSLKEILKSPAHYKAKLESKQIVTPAMILGSAIHCAVLEPELLDSKYIFESVDKRTKAYKEMCESHPDKTILSFEEKEKIDGIKSSIERHGISSMLLGKNENNLKEHALFFELDDLTCKAKIDCVNLSAKVIVDFKTTESATEKDFVKSIVNYGYDFQAAFYRLGIAATYKEKFDFIFIAVEKNPPYAVNCFELDHDALFRAHDKVLNSITVLKHCLKENDFPSYPPMLNKITLPKWSE